MIQNRNDMDAFKKSIAAVLDDPALNCYAIIDSAQDATLLARFESESLSVESECLLPAARGSDELAAVSPHLVALSPLAADGDAWGELLAMVARKPATMSLLASPLGFEALLEHLGLFTEVILPDNTEMIFAFWDPAVLGTILGQEGDQTLHVPGPVFTERQRAALLRDVSCWWYWDRDGGGQRVPGNKQDALGSALPKPPLKLVQVQVDMLVEAGVPDQLLALLAQNSPLLLRRVDPADRYGWVRKHLLEGRKLGLHSMLDLLNYLSACLIYGDALYKRPITPLLDRVRSREISFDEALAGMMVLETP